MSPSAAMLPPLTMVSNSVSEGGRPNHRCASRSATFTKPSAETRETLPLPMTKRLTE